MVRFISDRNGLAMNETHHFLLTNHLMVTPPFTEVYQVILGIPGTVSHAHFNVETNGNVDQVAFNIT
jgi:hypothetical protein